MEYGSNRKKEIVCNGDEVFEENVYSSVYGSEEKYGSA